MITYNPLAALGIRIGSPVQMLRHRWPAGNAGDSARRLISGNGSRQRCDIGA
jgi:hypothetical protein